MYDFYCNRDENNEYKNRKIYATQIDGSPVVRAYDLPATAQKSYYGKAMIIETAKESYLLSYDTIVCSVSGGAFKKLWNDWSKTTANHINDFIKFMLIGNGVNKKRWLDMDTYTDTGVIYTASDLM